MRIDLKQPHKSIMSLTTEELPDFAVLIGRNGAGKTQLLDALKEGPAVIPGIGGDDIELYDMVTFHPPNANVGNRDSNRFGKDTADAFLIAPPNGRPLIETAADIFDQYAGEIENTSGVEERDKFARNLKDEIRRLPDFIVFEPTRDVLSKPAPNQASPYKNALYEQVIAPLLPKEGRQRRRGQSNQSINSFNGNQATLLSSAMKLAGKLPHELTRDDIMRASNYEGGTISNAISEVFAAYKVDQFTWAHRRIETESVSYRGTRGRVPNQVPPTVGHSPRHTGRDAGLRGGRRPVRFRLLRS